MLVFKARPRRDPAQRVDLTESQKRIMRLLNTAMNEVRRDVIRDEGKLLDGLEHLSLDRIVNMVTDEPWLEMQQALQEELLGELNDAGKRVKLPAIQKATIVYSFDATRPEAAAWAQLEAGKMVSQVIESQRDVVRDYASRASMGDFTPRQVARGLRDVVGLTTQQSGWVQNFRDNEIGRQMATGKNFDQAYAASEKATDRYHNKIHKYRTETIARTETLRASNEGRNLAWQQGLDEGFINPNASKMWSAELDGRVCDLCAPLDGVIVPIKGSFSAGDPPRHPNCRCTVLLTDAIPTDISSMTDEELDAEINSLLSGFPDAGMGKSVSLSNDEFDEMKRFSGKDHIVGRNSNGSPIFTPERQALHDKIVNDNLMGIKSSQEPTFTMLGGGPASGKTTELGSIAGLNSRGVATIDPDAIKGLLPEYKTMLAVKDEGAAAFVHEESSYIAKRVQAAGFERRIDMVLDGTGDGGDSSLLLKINNAKENGYTVRGVYATITVDEAIIRSTARAVRSGRTVPVDIITVTHAKVSKAFPTAARNMDQVDLYDTTVRDTPRIIAKGEGGILRVLDESSYEEFLRKVDG